MLAKYPDLDGERSRIYLRNAFRVGLKNESLVLARKEGDSLFSLQCSRNILLKVKALVRTKLPRLQPMEKSPRRKSSRKRRLRALMQVWRLARYKVMVESITSCVIGKEPTKKATPKKVKKKAAKSEDEELTKNKNVKKSVEKKAVKSPAASKPTAKKSTKSPAAKKGAKSPSAKKAVKSPAAKKAAAKKATAKSPVAKKATKK